MNQIEIFKFLIQILFKTLRIANAVKKNPVLVFNYIFISIHALSIELMETINNYCSYDKHIHVV